MKKIIIADDHAVVRTGMQLILEETQDLSIADECRDGDELLEKLRQGAYDIVLLDIHMPGKDSVEVLKEIRREYPELPVVIFTMNNEDSFMIKIFQNGASAFISKDLPPGSIIEIIRKVLKQKRYLTEKQSEIIARLTIDMENSRPGTKDLSPREYQVLKEIALGKDYNEIAHNLGLSKNTIGNHRMKILKKLNLKNNSDLTRFAYKNGIIE
jgi:DNA-binding NarL/FixJ family response regulator